MNLCNTPMALMRSPCHQRMNIFKYLTQHLKNHLNANNPSCSRLRLGAEPTKKTWTTWSYGRMLSAKRNTSTNFQSSRYCSTTGLVPRHWSSTGLVPRHCSTTGLVPRHWSSTGLVPRHWSSTGLVPRHCSSTGLVPRCHYGTDSREATNEDLLSMNNPSFEAYLQHLTEEHQDITKRLANEKSVDGKKQKRLVRRLAELNPVVRKIEDWNEKKTELGEIEELISGSSATSQDKEMLDMAIEEKDECLEDKQTLEAEILILLTPIKETDDNDIIMEFSAGVGGQEAMLFTADMFQMYEKFAAYKNWGFERLGYFTTDLGGLRHATVSVSGDGAYKLLKHEGGVHRVQRVPKTEKAGRVHTSTMAVAVLPQPKEIDLKIDPKDLRIETKKASGAGGQHVNTTDSAVRIVHIPTNMVAESQQERSQIKNRNIAMMILQTKIFNSILEKRDIAERSMRRSQVGTSGRSEKIRTYNFQQDRVTDHRVGMSMFDVEGLLDGGEHLEEMILRLSEEEEKESLRRLVEDFEESRTES
ncbi:peptide chain release factor 1-like, mitochondrial isoform X2 [Asterias rubens]|uniref:peptide chain release factor 1-like, mitochondrial isoform X2 n=1 Tax=Asterias rubens TaxID=7604 RepID=UPI0014550E21|nr:peptide chain release factor 1-like, mitochondrial isoform X2 [Asterias rubens]